MFLLRYWGLSETLPESILPVKQREAWASWISPETLLSQVLNTAPFLAARFPAKESGALIALGNSPDGYLRILSNWENILRPGARWEEQLQDYFALCMACHHATVATFVPTDVDTKIRGLAWRETKDPEVLKPMMRLALNSRQWADDGISLRRVRNVSGHDGEHWSAIAGGLGWLLERGENTVAEEALAAIEEEIDREQAVFDAAAREQGGELDVLRLAMTLAHNHGDLTQGMGFWKNNVLSIPTREHLTVRGEFKRAVAVYQKTGISAEGHRHYPLRPVKSLRQSPETLLPLCPFLDEWGMRVAQLEDRHEVMEALVIGCQKVAGQEGYYRALAGMREASGSDFERAAKRMSNGNQRLLKDASMRKKLDVPRASFESSMRKKARAAL